MRKLQLDELEPRRYEPLDELPQIVKDHLGDEEHAGLLVQRGASVVYTHVSDDNLILTSLEKAIEEHPDLVKEHFAQRLPYDEGKFQPAPPRSGPAGRSSTCPRTSGSRSRSRSSG